MQLEPLRLTLGRTLNLAPNQLPTEQEDAVHVLLCERLARVVVPMGMIGLWCPLTNGMWVETMGSRSFVGRGELYVSDVDFAHEVTVPSRGAVIAVLARATTWQKMMALSPASRRILPPVFPAVQSAGCPLRLAFLRLVRCAMLETANVDEMHSWRDWGELMARVQSPMVALFHRCPGSSVTRRSQIFMRLQRVRHLLQVGFARDIHVSALAALSNYSRGRLIRLFTQVFGESPYSFLLQTRIENASQLIRQTDMNLSEVWRMVGFENRASFARSFKKRAGETASAFRAASREVECIKD
ncbi:AraC family transcriptional regulator [Pseudolysobacter antarcticus]|uniref:AraC family transcriptional regulator n=1 Tax=Pseudolysobacter antarcticus TaxID=2511995 RepID=A0A411HL86_9GAMM|nr:AraC family transcriptional regulator [Pseudolysobacter antarcticus]QBB71174.1 AraC family transcriptional regulator [Pseudolysobacter antarcticus]